MKKIGYALFSLVLCVPGYSQTFSGGEGTEASPYQIKTVADLTELATVVTGGDNLEGKYLRLENDITYASTEEFTVIGTNTKKFNGCFDGNGHTISGLLFDGSTYQGFVGYADKAAVIKNLNLASPTLQSTGGYGGCIVGRNDGLVDNCQVTDAVITISAGSYKGGIAGQSNGTVQNCSFSGSITTLQSAAGIVGQNYGKIINCHSSATIVSQTESSSSTHLGGIAGVSLALNSEPEIVDCYFTGTITGGYQNNCGAIVGSSRGTNVTRCWSAAYVSSSGESSHCGGILGTFESGIIKDCYSASTLYNTTSANVGGIAGYCSPKDEAVVETCLVYGPIFNSILLRQDNCEILGVVENGEVTVTNCFFDEQVSGSGSAVGGKTTRALTTATPLTGFDADTWSFADGLYPRLTKFSDLEVAALYAVPIYFAEGETQSKVQSDFELGTYPGMESMVSESSLVEVNGNNVKVTRGAAQEEITVTYYLGESMKRNLVKIYPLIFTGQGTEANPYLISSVDDFNKFIAATNEQGLCFEGDYFKLTTDLDLNYAAITPISSANEALGFAGIFDGDNHTINNLALDNLTESKLNVALFKQVTKDGVVKNLKIADNARFNVYRSFAPFVCTLYGTVDNCYNYASFTPSAGFSGGLVYVVEETGVVKNCFNGGNIVVADNSTNGSVGGIAGFNYGTIENCLNAGNIEATGSGSDNVGGIAYSSWGTIKSVMNMGLVKGVEAVGGIVGAHAGGSIVSALSVAPVVSTGNYDEVGAVAGSAEADDLTEAYYDNQIAIYEGVTHSAIGKNTTELTDPQTALFADESAWTRVSGQYPVLSHFADEPHVQFLLKPIVVADNALRTQVDSEIVLPSDDNISWSLQEGSIFSLVGNKVEMNGSSSFAEDVLTGTQGTFRRELPISTLGDFLTGKGTEAEPYQIATADDLEKLSTEVLKSKSSYKGCYFKFMADIDMTGISFSPIAPESVAKFEGTVLGNGKTIKSLAIEDTQNNSVGLFARLGAAALIDSLTIDEASSVEGVSYVGAFAGLCEGTIENCHNYASVTATKGHVGGIAGSAQTGAVLNRCVNDGAVSGAGNVGGIVGYLENAELSALENNADVTSTASYTGGVVGYVNGYAKGINWINRGRISGTSETGGLVGYAYKSYETGCLELDSSFNAGYVTGSKTNLGGLIGKGDANVITKCFNTGDVVSTAEKVSTSACGAAGLVGYGVPQITDSYNAGNVSAVNGVGGIVAYPSSSYTAFAFDHVYSVGKVVATGESSKNVGAILGKASSKLTMNQVVYDADINKDIKAMAGDDAEATPLKTAALVQTNMGDNWVSYPNHYPVIAGFETTPEALVYSAAVVLDENDSYEQVTKDFAVGVQGGVTWSGDDVFTFSNGSVAVQAGAQGSYTLTASLDGVEKEVPLVLNVPGGSGVESLEAGEVSAYAVAGGVVFTTACEYAVYNTSGALVAVGKTQTDDEFVALEAGVYVVCIGNKGTLVRVNG